MAHQFRIEPTDRIVLFEASGVFSHEEALTCFAEISSHPDFEEGFDHLIDLSRVVQYETSAQEIREIALPDSLISTKLVRARVAVVASRSHIYGLMRMYGILMEGSATDVAIFQRLAQAAEWLEVRESLLRFFARGHPDWTSGRSPSSLT